MSIIDETRFVERLHFFNGQRLFASDLQGLEAFNREMRWLHNQSLHQPGVGNGFAVAGEKGDREITIGPGYSIDSQGREIVLTETETLPIPPVAGNKGQPIFFDLTVAYPDDAALEEAETRQGVCESRGAVRLREAPVFCWIELEGENLVAKKPKLRTDLQSGLRIRLARIEVLNCQLNSKVSIANRQSARPAQTPYISSGVERINTIEPFATSLTTKIPNMVAEVRLIRSTVKTARAEFLTTPEYTAHITGPRRLTLKTSNQDVAVLIIDQFHVTRTARDEFDVFALVVAIDLDGASLESPDALVGAGKPVKRIEAVEDQIKEQWRIVWMGVEA